MDFKDRSTAITAIFLLSVMALISFFSMREDSLTFDEMSHIPDGYSYLVTRDYRLNPEHPPLVKDLAALPLLAMNLNFPFQSDSWKTWTPDQQWRFGPEFLYRSGNNPDKIVFAARTPMIGILLLLGFLIFRWARELGGNKAALIALALFAFSPTFIAHGRLVTTDVPASLGIVAASYAFFKFLKDPSRNRIIVSGVVLGIALLFKFTVIIMVPVLGLVWLISFTRRAIKEWKQKEEGCVAAFINKFATQTARLFLVFLIAFIVIGIVYGFHVSGYAPQDQKLHTQYTVAMYDQDPEDHPIYGTLIWAADKPILRAYEQYALGLTMNIRRSSFGNTTYFLDEIASSGWRSYFPFVYLIKNPLALHALTLFALGIWFVKIIKRGRKKGAPDRIEKRLEIPAFLIFVALYWIVSIKSNLNIGVRHVLPTFPFIYILIALPISRWLDETTRENSLKSVLKDEMFRIVKYLLVFLLLFWYAGNVLKSYPFYISYFNELAGGGENGHRYAVDSNLDWGQDFKRLKNFLETNGIERIYLDYFGGADATYYLGEKFIPWWSDLGPPKGYFAISLTKLKGAQALPVKGFTLRPEERYAWLEGKEPIAKIGHSIWVYYFD